jgi:hypothetical protein
MTFEISVDSDVYIVEADNPKDAVVKVLGRATLDMYAKNESFIAIKKRPSASILGAK